MKNFSISLALVFSGMLWLVLAQSATAATPPFTRCINAPSYFDKSEISDIAALGPRLVRYQLIDPDADTHDSTQYQAWLDAALTELDSVLPTFATHGIQVLIDMHTAPGGFASRTEPTQHAVFADANHQAHLIQIWQTIAARYVGNTTVWGYEIMSEPNEGTVAPGLKNWNALAAEIIEDIRAVDADHYIVVQSTYGNPDRLGRLTKHRDENIIYAFNFYLPTGYTKQGVEGYAYPVTYPSGTRNKGQLVSKIEKYKKLAKKRKIKLMVGEFSVVRWAPNGARYLRDLVSVFEKGKKQIVGYCYHSWGDSNVWSLTHTDTFGSDDEATTPTERYLTMQEFYQRGR